MAPSALPRWGEKGHCIVLVLVGAGGLPGGGGYSAKR